MADVSITAANVLKATTGITLENGTAGATITAGQVVYLDAADSEYKLCDADSATAAVRDARGIALHGASDGQPLTILRRGPVTIGGTLVAGLAYYASDAAGGIAPYADLASGDFVISLGIATTTAILDVNIQSSGVAL